MRHVLSLIAGKAKALSTYDLDRALETLGQAAATSGAPDWLAPQECCDIPFEGEPKAVLAAVRQAFAGEPVDVNVVPTAARRKRLLLADMDSTIIEQECIDELAAEIGMRDAVAAITERAMRGEIAFEPALRERVALLKGLPLAVIETVLATRITVSPGAAVLIATMRAAGGYTSLVSGGFTLFTGAIAKRVGFDDHRANRLVEEGGTLAGLVAEPILGRAAKEERLEELRAELRLSLDETLAIGDGANDSGMVSRAGLGVAYRAKPALREAADAIIDHADLTGVLYLQGFRREAFAAPQS